MKKKVAPYNTYYEKLSDVEKALIDSYFTELNSHIALPKKYSLQMVEDFQNALIYYAVNGVDAAEATKRMEPSKLGGFYVRPPLLWYPLDDAAKVYPLSMKRNQMVVYRLSIYTKEKVVPELLQVALTFTIKRFPGFATTVKKGFFWNYLDTAKRRFAVLPETDIPCRPINISASGSQSFRILYHENRISAEMFHALTDGSGAMIFMKTLVAEYLRLLGISVPNTEGVMDIGALPLPAETENFFPKVDKTQKSSGLSGKRTVQMSGKQSRVKPCRVLHYEFDSSELYKAAKSRGVSVTAYMLSRIFVSQRSATDSVEGITQIQVPVNMRKYYPTDTLRNFSLYCCIGLPLSQIVSADGILPEIETQLKERASKQSMDEMAHSAETLVSCLRFVPLFIKRPVAVLIYGFIGAKVFANGLSNLGVIKLPPEMEPYVEKIDCVLGTADMNRAACAMATYKNKAVLTVAKYTTDPSFEEKLYELFSNDGLEVDLKGSPKYEG